MKVILSGFTIFMKQTRYTKNRKKKKISASSSADRDCDNFPTTGQIRDSAVESVCQGAQLAIPGILSISKGIQKGEIVRVVTGKGELVAIAEAQLEDSQIKSQDHGIATITRRVIMNVGTYPKMWKSKREEVGTEEISEKLLKQSILDSWTKTLRISEIRPKLDVL